MSKDEQAEAVFQEVSTYLSPEEIVQSYVFPPAQGRSEAERQQQEELVRKYLQRKAAELSDTDRLLNALMEFKVKLHRYLTATNTFDPDYTFGKQLKRYLKIIDRNQSEFARNVQLHRSRMSRILNDKEAPSIDLMYRIEQHCDHFIPATYWFGLHTRKLTYDMQRDTERRNAEFQKVTNGLELKQAS